MRSLRACLAMANPSVAGTTPPTSGPVTTAATPSARTAAAFVERTGSGSSGWRPAASSEAASAVAVVSVIPLAHHAMADPARHAAVWPVQPRYVRAISPARARHRAAVSIVDVSGGYSDRKRPRFKKASGPGQTPGAARVQRLAERTEVEVVQRNGGTARRAEPVVRLRVPRHGVHLGLRLLGRL